jgi:hypothetical protein
LSLKENVNAIKEELSAEEQFLESVIKAEGFWKKYKKIIIALGVVVVVGALAKVGMDYIHQSNIEASNKAYNILLKDSQNSTALATLKEKNPQLYEMFLFKRAVESADVAALQKVESDIKDPLLSDLLKYQRASLEKSASDLDTKIVKDFALLEEAYLLLQDEKVKEANAKLSQIPVTSPLRNIVANLKHYMGK